MVSGEDFRYGTLLPCLVQLCSSEVMYVPFHINTSMWFDIK
jgi:hypothetical protein